MSSSDDKKYYDNNLNNYSFAFSINIQKHPVKKYIDFII